jgi:hypothetical protein
MVQAPLSKDGDKLCLWSNVSSLGCQVFVAYTLIRLTMGSQVVTARIKDGNVHVDQVWIYVVP